MSRATLRGMTILQLVVLLLIIGVLLGLVNKYGPPWVTAPYIQLINTVVVVATILWLLWLLAAWAGLAPLAPPFRPLR
jgi:hypothetical protein